MKQFNRKMMFCISLIMSCMLAGCGQAKAEPVTRLDTAMGTVISQRLYVTDQDRGDAYAKEILQLITDLEEDLLSWRLGGSEVSAINRQAGNSQGIFLTPDMTNIISNCIRVSEEAGGAFDITIGSVVRLWDIDKWTGQDTAVYALPSEQQINVLLQDIGYEKLSLEGNTLYLPDKLQIDLGAVGKGIALQEILDYLQNTQKQDKPVAAVISVGGSILTYGEKPEGGDWKVGIVNPFNVSENIGYLSLKGQWCVSTSGDYERYIEINNKRYHHIIDPKTGYPAEGGVRSVTILTKDGLLSDALSTACFILGVEGGSELAESFGAEALFINHEGTLYMTDGMQQYFTKY